MTDMPRTSADLKGWLGLAPTTRPTTWCSQESINAALVAQARVCNYPKDPFGQPEFTSMTTCGTRSSCEPSGWQPVATARRESSACPAPVATSSVPASRPTTPTWAPWRGRTENW